MSQRVSVLAVLLAALWVPAVSAQVIFFADFEDGMGVNDPSQWVPDNAQQNWAIQPFPGSGNGLAQTVEGCGISGNTPLPGVTNFKDGIVQLDMSWNDDDSWGVVVRQTSASAGYLIVFGYIETPAVLITDLADGCGTTGQCLDGTGCENGGAELLQVDHGLGAGLTQDLSVSYTGRVEMDGDTIRIWYLPTASIADDPLGDFGPPLVEFQDDAHPGPGAVGIWHESQGGSMIDNVIVMVGDPGSPSLPKPADGATDVPPYTDLSWTPGAFAASHDVYLSTTFNDANDRSAGALVSQGQTGTSFSDADLALETTYYWAIDEINSPPDSTVYPGPVWSFTVEPHTYPIQGVTAIASSEYPGAEAVKVVDGSGLTDGLHDTTAENMWLTAVGTTLPASIEFDLGGVYKLGSVSVWNQNQATENILGLGVKGVSIETSLNGSGWTAINGEVEFAQASGDPGYAANTIVDLGGVGASHVRFTINSNYSMLGLPQAGLSEVQFNYVPVAAREPMPADGAALDTVDVTATWRPGRGSTESTVYLGTDPNNLEKVGTSNNASFDIGAEDPQLGQSYYWQVVETEASGDWASPTWSFSISEPLVVDDFEGFAARDPADPGAIFNVWLDGFDSNNNSSLVGNSDVPYPEQTIVRNTQSMPFYYGEGPGSVAEATRTFSPVRDWTRAGIKTLVLYFYGSADNAAGGVYVKINDTRVDFDEANATQTPVWQQMNVDLGALNVSQVRSLTVGVDSSGSGLVYFDDILLYRGAPEPIAAVDPGTDALVAYYDMENSVQDATGNGYDGTPLDGATFVPGRAGSTALQLDGTTGFVDLGIGPLMPSLSDATFAIWVNNSGNSGAWARILDFGSGTADYMFLTPQSGNNTLRFAIRTNNAAESIVEAGRALPTGWHHVAITIDASSMTMRLYLDGDLVDEGTTDYLPSQLGNTTQNWLGDSQYAADPFFNGMLDDFQIYNRALSAGEIRYLAGDR